MASNMSGYTGAGGAQRWMQESGGDQAAYDREMQAWQSSQQPAAAPAAPRNTGGATGRGAWPQAPQPTANQDTSALEKAFDTQRSGGGAPGTTSDRYRDPRYSPAQWGAWEEEERNLYRQGKSANQAGDCPPDKPFTSREGPNGERACTEKPDDCPPGSHVVGTPGRCVADGSDGGGGGGGGQGGGGGVGGGGGYGGGGSAWDNPIYSYLGSSGLQAAQDPEKALQNYMGWGGANQFQQQMDQARAQVMAMPPGPARDAAAARLEEQKMTNLGAMRQQATGQARGELHGLIGTEQGYNQMGLQESQFGRSLAEQARQANMQNQLGWGGLSLQGELGRGNLGLGWAGQNLAQQQFADATGAGRAFQANQAALDRQAQINAIKAQANANKPSTFDRILGVLSDIRVKENIEELPSLSKLREIPVYSYNYTFEPERRRVGVMAQDVERVAPELVEEGADGLKRVDSYGLLALTMAAVKDLSNGSN